MGSVISRYLGGLLHHGFVFGDYIHVLERSQKQLEARWRPHARMPDDAHEELICCRDVVADFVEALFLQLLNRLPGHRAAARLSSIASMIPFIFAFTYALAFMKIISLPQKLVAYVQAVLSHP